MKINNELKEKLKKVSYFPVIVCSEELPLIIISWDPDFQLREEGEVAVFPVRNYIKLEENIVIYPYVQFLALFDEEKLAYKFRGKARIEKEGELFERMKKKNPKAEAALVIRILKVDKEHIWK
ncbi:MAG: hypothetical protein AB1410_00835 [Acidobacteriota bacterium]